MATFAEMEVASPDMHNQYDWWRGALQGVLGEQLRPTPHHVGPGSGRMRQRQRPRPEACAKRAA